MITLLVLIAIIIPSIVIHAFVEFIKNDYDFDKCDPFLPVPIAVGVVMIIIGIALLILTFCP